MIKITIKIPAFLLIFAFVPSFSAFAGALETDAKSTLPPPPVEKNGRTSFVSWMERFASTSRSAFAGKTGITTSILTALWIH
jgi:hypothetical protein